MTSRSRDCQAGGATPRLCEVLSRVTFRVESTQSGLVPQQPRVPPRFAAVPLVSGTGSGSAPTDNHRRVELWHALAAIVLLLLVAEGVLVQR